MASASAESLGNWVQKWHLASRSDRLEAISIFAKSGTVDVPRPDEEKWERRCKRGRKLPYELMRRAICISQNVSEKKGHMGNEERLEDVRVGIRAAVFRLFGESAAERAVK